MTLESFGAAPGVVFMLFSPASPPQKWPCAVGVMLKVSIYTFLQKFTATIGMVGRTPQKGGLMKNLFALFTVALLVSCAGESDDSPTGSVTEAFITDFAIEECLCCPGVTLETDGGTYFVEEFPDFTVDKENLPIRVLVQIEEYKGECPNRDVSVNYLN